MPVGGCVLHHYWLTHLFLCHKRAWSVISLSFWTYHEMSAFLGYGCSCADRPDLSIVNHGLLALILRWSRIYSSWRKVWQLVWLVDEHTVSGYHLRRSALFSFVWVLYTEWSRKSETHGLIRLVTTTNINHAVYFRLNFYIIVWCGIRDNILTILVMFTECLALNYSPLRS